MEGLVILLWVYYNWCVYTNIGYNNLKVRWVGMIKIRKRADSNEKKTFRDAFKDIV